MRYNVADPDAFFAATAGIDMSASPAMDRFLAHVPADGVLLDAGCGSGRDAAHFARLGHRVEAFDAHPELVERARKAFGINVETDTFEAFDRPERYDGIWACAALLHLPPDALPGALTRLARALRPGGVLYASFKDGAGTRTDRAGRFFHDLGPDALRAQLDAVPGLTTLETFFTPDSANRPDTRWTNALARRR